KREAKCYRKVPVHPYTRVEYIKSVPQSKIRIFNMGNPNERYDYKVMLISKQRAMILARALEAARIATNRYLSESIGKGTFFIRVRPVPHAIVRERKFLGTAGADRIQKGMRRAYGKPSDRAAIVEVNDIILELWVHSKDLETAKKAAKLAAYKIGVSTRIEVTPFSK
ncbi:MAG: 50S ribosomal protein L16, partial [Crenarchaeota archaeon]|nr:50S ribosomal protein L16 [Thermoproteota archaeon]